jgi:RNA-binding protein Musashi
MKQKLPSKLIFSSNHPQTTMQKLRNFPSLSIAVMNNYQAAAAQGYGPPTSPHATNTRTGFPAANSPGPTIDMYSSNGGDSVSYVQATSPQPSGFPAIAVSRAPLNYSPVSIAKKFCTNFLRKSSP